MMSDNDERDSDLFPDIDVEIHEDFNDSNNGRRHSSDPDLPLGLPPLGEGIPSSPSKIRTSSLNSDGGKNRASSLDSAGGAPGKVKKKRSMAFGFYDEKRKERTRLMR